MLLKEDMDTVIQTDKLTKYFGDFCAVDRVTFEVHAGEVVGYLGPNGSGKTTTIRLLLGLLLPSDGHAKVLGYDILSQSEEIRASVGYMSQKFALYQELTVLENISFYAGVYGIRDPERLKQVIQLVELVGHENTRVQELSVGWRQRLALATAIVHNPKLLFLDEPTSGVDPSARRAFWDLIYELVERGVTAFVTTHYMDEAEYCGRIGIMRDGELLAMDTPSVLKETALPGVAWDVFVKPLLPALESLAECRDVLRVGLVEDHLRVITSLNVEAGVLENYLRGTGFKDFYLEIVSPSLEDVFLTLARKGELTDKK